MYNVIMAYKAVLFDLDGTLLDTLQDIADATNATLRQLGFPIQLGRPTKRKRQRSKRPKSLTTLMGMRLKK